MKIFRPKNRSTLPERGWIFQNGSQKKFWIKIEKVRSIFRFFWKSQNVDFLSSKSLEKGFEISNRPIHVGWSPKIENLKIEKKSFLSTKSFGEDAPGVRKMFASREGVQNRFLRGHPFSLWKIPLIFLGKNPSLIMPFKEWHVSRNCLLYTSPSPRD